MNRPLPFLSRGHLQTLSLSLDDLRFTFYGKQLRLLGITVQFQLCIILRRDPRRSLWQVDHSEQLLGNSY